MFLHDTRIGSWTLIFIYTNYLLYLNFKVTIKHYNSKKYTKHNQTN